VRLEYGPWVRQPLRVVLDPKLTCDPRARVFRDDEALIFAATDAEPRPESTIRTERVPRTPTGLDLDAVVARLAALEVNELLVECGPRLAAGFLAADLVDELILYMAPHFLGADAAPLAALNGLHDPQRRPRFEFQEQRLVGRDLRLALTPRRG